MQQDWLHAKDIGQQELDALDRAVKHAQDAAVRSSSYSRDKQLSPGALQDNATSKPARQGGLKAAEQQSHTPWTVNNATLPAYPTNEDTPVPMMQKAGIRISSSDVYDQDQISQSSHPRATSHESNTPLPAAAMHMETMGPTQVGPLALYPTFALVDPKHRWQRIQQWALMDSHNAALASKPANESLRVSRGGDDGWTMAESLAQDVHSISPSMLELEQQRAQNSLPHSPQPPPNMTSNRHATTAMGRQQVLTTQARPAPPPPAPRAHEPPAFIPAHVDVNTPLLTSSVDQLLSLLETIPGTHAAGAATTKLRVSAAASSQLPTVPTTSAQHMGRNTTYTNTIGAVSMDVAPTMAAPAASTTTAKTTTVQSISQAAGTTSHSQNLLNSALQALQHCTAVDQERAHLREATLEAALSSERALAARLQAQLATELARSAAAAGAENQSRLALTQASKALEIERRKSQEARQRATVEADKAATQIRTLTAKCASLESKMQQEKESSARLQRKLSSSTKTISRLEEELHVCEVSRADSAARLEAADSQVTLMRSELNHMKTHLAARERRLTAHLQELEETQLAQLQQELDASQDLVLKQHKLLASLGLPLLTLAQALNTQPLSVALHLQPERLVVFSASPNQHQALVDRLAGMVEHLAAGSGDGLTGSVATQQQYAQDVAALATRVRELLTAVQQVCLHAERAEVAAASENEAQFAELQSQIDRLQEEKEHMMQAHAVRESDLSLSLQSSKQRVDELLSEVDQLKTQLTATQASAQAAANMHMQQLHEEITQGAVRAAALVQDVTTWQERALEAERKLGDLSGSLSRVQEMVEAKEARVMELHKALAHAHDSTAQADAARAQSMLSGQAAIEELMSQLTASEAKTAGLQQVQEQLQQHLEDSHMKQGQLEAELRGVEQQLEAKRKEVHKMQQQLDSVCSCLSAAARQMLDVVPEGVLDLDVLVVNGGGGVDDGNGALRRCCEELRRMSMAGWQGAQYELAESSIAALGVMARMCVEGLVDAQQVQESVRKCLHVVADTDASVGGAAARLGVEMKGQAAAAQQGMVNQPRLLRQTVDVLVLEVQGLAGKAQHLLAGLERRDARDVETSTQMQRLQQELTSSKQLAEERLSNCQQHLEARVRDLDRQLAQSQASSQELQGRLNLNAKDMRALQAVLVVLHRQKSDADAHLNIAQQQSLELRSQLARCQAQLDATQEQLVAYQQAVQTSGSKVPALIRKCQLMKCRYRVLFSRHVAFQKGSHNLRRTLRDLTQGAKRQTTALQAAEVALSREQSKVSAAEALNQSQQAKMQRADALLTKLEERRASLEADKRSLTDKLNAANARAAAAEQACASARQRESSARQEHQRALRAATQRCAAAEARAATLLEALEGAEQALRESQANSNRLLQFASHGPSQAHVPTSGALPPDAPSQTQPASPITSIRLPAHPQQQPQQQDDLTSGHTTKEHQQQSLTSGGSLSAPSQQHVDATPVTQASQPASPTKHSSTLQAAVMQLYSQVEVLHEQLHQAHMEAAGARAGQMAVEAKNMELNEELVQTSNRLQTELQQAHRLHSEHEARVHALVDELHHLKSSRTALEVEVDTATRDNAVTAERLAATRDLLAASDRDLQETRQQCSILQEQVQVQTEELQQLRHELDQLQAHAKVQKEDELKQAMSQVDAQSQALAAAQLTINQLQAELLSAEHQLKHASEDTMAHASMHQALEKQVQELSAAHAAREQQLEADAQQQVHSARQEVAHAQAELQRAQQQVHGLQVELQACGQHWMGKLHDIQSKAHGDLEVLREELEHAHEDASRYEEKLEAHTRKINDLEAALEDTHCQLRACQLEQYALQYEREARQLSAEIQQGMNEGGHHAGVDREEELQEALARVEILERRLVEVGEREGSYGEEVAAARYDLSETMREMGQLRDKNNQLRAELEAALKQLAAVRVPYPVDDDTDSMSTMTGITGRTVRMEQHNSDGMENVALLVDNQALMGRLQRTHAKLKLARARIVQLEAALQIGSQSTLEHAQRCEGSEVSLELHSASQGATGEPLYVQAYQAALKASQEEAALAMSQLAAAQQQVELLTRQRQDSHKQPPGRIVLPASMQQAVSGGGSISLDDVTSADDETRDQQSTTHTSDTTTTPSPLDHDTKAVLQLIRNQGSEIRMLQEALSTSHTKRAQDVRQATQLAEALAAAQRQVRELESVTYTMQHQLKQAQTQSAFMRDQLLEGGPASRRHRDSSTSLDPQDDDHREGEGLLPRYTSDSVCGSDVLRMVDEASTIWRDVSGAQAMRIRELEEALMVMDRDLQYTHTLMEEAQLKAHQNHMRAEAAEASLSAMTHQSQADLSNAEQQVVQLTCQRQSLTDQLCSSQQICDDLRHQVDQMTSTLTATQTSMRHEEHARTHLAKEMHQLEDAYKQMQEENQALAMQLSQIKHELTGALLSATTMSSFTSTPSLHALPPPESTTPHDLATLIRHALTTLSQSSDAASAVNKELHEANALLQMRAADIATLNNKIKSQAAKISEQASSLAAAKEVQGALENKLQRKESELRVVEAEISRQLQDYGKLRARLLMHEQDSNRLSSGSEAMARKCDELHAALAAKQADCAAVQAKCGQQQEQIAELRHQLIESQERLRAMDMSHQMRHRADQHAEQVVQELQSELAASQQTVQVLKTQLEKKMGEVRELHQMLKAWEAMRLGKDAQIAALMERCKRHEEDAADKARTVDALRKKLVAYTPETSSFTGTNSQQIVMRGEAGRLSPTSSANSRVLPLAR